MMELRQRRAQVRSPQHLTWIRSHHCCVDGCCRRPVTVHHVRTGGTGGMAMTPGDQWGVPICHPHHVEHNHLGWQSFETKYRIDLRQMASVLAAQSPFLPTDQ